MGRAYKTNWRALGKAVARSGLPVLFILSVPAAFTVRLEIAARDQTAEPTLITVTETTRSLPLGALELDDEQDSNFSALGDDPLRETDTEVLTTERSRLWTKLALDQVQSTTQLSQVFLGLSSEQRKDARIAGGFALRMARLGDADAALGLLEDVLTSKDLSPQNRGLVYYYQGRLQQQDNPQTALALYNKAAQEYPSHCGTTLARGTLYLSGKKDGPARDPNLLSAISILERASELCTGKRRVRALYGLGHALSRSGQSSKALNAFLRAIDFEPAHLSARISMARIYRDALNRPAEARRLYLEVLKLDASYLPAHLGLATMAKRENKRGTALSILEKARTLNPDSPTLLYQLATTLLGGKEGEQDKTNDAQTKEAVHILRSLAASRPSDARIRFQLSRALSQTKDYVAAEKSYTQAIALGGTRLPQAHNNLALVLRQRHDDVRAEAELKKAVELDNEYISAHYNLGLLYLDTKRMSDAVAEFSWVTKKDPEKFGAWYNLGLSLGRQSDSAGALRAYERAVTLEPTNIKARLNLAILLKRSGQLEKAIQHYKLATTIEPKYAAAWFNLGLALKEARQLDAAEDAYQRALKLDPEDTGFLLSLANLHTARGEYKASADVLSEALERTPNDVRLRYNLAIQHNRLGDSKAAIVDLEQCVSLDPDYYKAWRRLGKFYTEARNDNKALKAYTRALKLQENDADLIFSRAKVLARLGRNKDAYAQVLEAIRLVPDDPWMWFHRGKMEQRLGLQGAERSFLRAMQLDPEIRSLSLKRLASITGSLADFRALLKEHPNSVPIRLALSRALRNEEKQAEAQALLEEAVRRAPEKPQAWRELGDLLYDNQQYDAAVRALEKAYALRPTEEKIALPYAKALYRAGRYNSALELLLTAREAHPKNSTIGVWLGRAQRKTGDREAAGNTFKAVLAQDPKNYQAHVGLGDVLRNGSKKSDALAHYQHALRLKPDSKEARRKFQSLQNELSSAP